MASTLMYDATLPIISQLQQAVPHAAHLMESVSVTFDPKYAFLIYAPVAFILAPLIGKRLILAIVVAEWLNQILKWLSFGERPYWYLYSSQKFDPTLTPIRQFPATCETGPGAPSGHSQLTAAVWFVLLESLNELAAEYLSSHSIHQTAEQEPEKTTTTVNEPKRSTFITLRNIQLASRALYVSIVAIVAVSRIYLACHFPQQCLVGALFGHLIASQVLKNEPKAVHLMILSLAMPVTAFGIYFLMLAFGFNPSWTFELASKHCENPDYIHADTTPFFSIMRYCGFALGSGLGLMVSEGTGLSFSATAVESSDALAHAASAKTKQLEASDGDDDNRSALMKVSTKLAAALISARLVDNLGAFVSHTNVGLFYSAAFATYTAFSFIVVNL